jgi:hypothetical protein
MAWLSKLFGTVGKVIGKAKGVAGAGIRMFDKAKLGYDAFKSTLSTLPMIGDVASGLVKRAETKLANVIQEKTGVDPAMLEKGVGAVRQFAGMPMTGM